MDIPSEARSVRSELRNLKKELYLLEIELIRADLLQYKQEAKSLGNDGSGKKAVAPVTKDTSKTKTASVKSTQGRNSPSKKPSAKTGSKKESPKSTTSGKGTSKPPAAKTSAKKKANASTTKSVKSQPRQTRKTSSKKSTPAKKVPEETKAQSSEMAKYYPYSELMKRPLPDGVDKKRIEISLSDEEFLKLFKVSKERYEKMPSWRKSMLKRELKLF